VTAAALWLCLRVLVRDHRTPLVPLVPPLRLVRVDRSHLSLSTPRRSRHA
jgi:hypothetical protein